MADYAGSEIVHAPQYSAGGYVTEISWTEIGVVAARGVWGMDYITDVNRVDFAEEDAPAPVTVPVVRDEPVMPRRVP